MTLRRLDLLIIPVRQSTDNLDANRVKDDEVIQYFNDAQKSIQSIILQAHPEADIFSKEGFFDLVSGKESYSLLADLVDANDVVLTDVYANNAIASVERSAGDFYFPIRRISNKERRTGYGYIIQDNSILISPFPLGTAAKGARVVYIRKLPTIDKRRGTITGFNSGVDITISGFDATLDLDTVAEKLTVVGKDGVIKQDNINLDTFSTGTGVITTDSTLTGIAIGDFVVLGKRATTHSELPDSCETFLLDYVKRRIKERESSTDFNNQTMFTKEEEERLQGLFQNNVPDASCPEIIETSYMVF